jgi:hypothetical protein
LPEAERRRRRRRAQTLCTHATDHLVALHVAAWASKGEQGLREHRAMRLALPAARVAAALAGGAVDMPEHLRTWAAERLDPVHGTG